MANAQNLSVRFTKKFYIIAKSLFILDMTPK